MALRGAITPEQLTTFVLYVEFVTAASLSVCDQWGRGLAPRETWEALSAWMVSFVRTEHHLHGLNHLELHALVP